MNLNIETTGVEDTIRALNNLGGAFASQGYETGLAAAARVVAREARGTDRFKDKTGNLRASIRVKKGLPRFFPSYLVLVTAPHGGLVTIGTKERYQRKTGRYTGKVKGNQFLTKAAEKDKQGQLNAFKRGVDREGSKIQRELARGTGIRRRTLRNL